MFYVLRGVLEGVLTGSHGDRMAAKVVKCVHGHWHLAFPSKEGERAGSSMKNIMTSTFGEIRCAPANVVLSSLPQNSPRSFQCSFHLTHHALLLPLPWTSAEMALAHRDTNKHVRFDPLFLKKEEERKEEKEVRCFCMRRCLLF